MSYSRILVGVTSEQYEYLKRVKEDGIPMSATIRSALLSNIDSTKKSGEGKDGGLHHLEYSVEIIQNDIEEIRRSISSLLARVDKLEA